MRTVDIDFANRRQLARLITQVENDPEAAAAIVRAVWPRTGQARRIGITGPPGSGKSTVVDQIIERARAEGARVAVIAVDPSSPFSGGAILGDRVRMLRHSGDADVFIRSMAARSAVGGLAAATRDAAHLLDAFEFDVILLETVGVGQSELDVMRAADTVVVITVPGLGDSIQMLKAGVLEIADLLVVNKADRPGADETAMHLREMLRMAPPSPGAVGAVGAVSPASAVARSTSQDVERAPVSAVEWSTSQDVERAPASAVAGGHLSQAWNVAWEIPVLKTVATDGTGIDALWQTIRRHREFLRESGQLGARRRQRVEREVLEKVEQALAAHLRSRLAGQPGLGEILARARAGDLDPHSAARAILDHLLKG
ncbi:MAG: methylmalonyl Co-A mutase-associated GTPase MeaB [Armatimonadetes bacterium]|nr:methylmalonyl Co-A mutase-associated GTPase MeaB [Armatimonadota bacterium]